MSDDFIKAGFRPGGRGTFVTAKVPKTIAPIHCPWGSLLCSPNSAAAQHAPLKQCSPCFRIRLRFSAAYKSRSFGYSMKNDLPLDWEILPLGEVVNPSRPRIKPSQNPDLQFIGMEHVEAHTMKLLQTVPAGTMKSSAVHFQPGDVLYGRLRPYLNKVYRPKFEGLCSAEFIVFPETDGLDSRYLQYFLNSSTFVSFASHLNTGDRPRVDFDQLAPYPFPLAPLRQQKRIVAEIEKQFSRLDEAVANLKRVKANLKR
ncbi:MAG: restriction endonuclease subunit S [Verrucomicrobia bacterium]|nr:restriction endonuclease subunit S [Verrucomicrobiota bacterium]